MNSKEINKIYMYKIFAVQSCVWLCLYSSIFSSICTAQYPVMLCTVMCSILFVQCGVGFECEVATTQACSVEDASTLAWD